VSLLDRPLIVLAALAYLAAVSLLGLWALRRTRDARDFWIAGRGQGVVVTGLATMAAAFSGFVFLGGPGLTYRIGLSSLFINASVGFTSGLLCWTVAKRLRLLAEAREVYTVPDAVLARFGSRFTSGAAAAAILVGSVGYLGAQLLALGTLLEAALGLEALAGRWSLALAVGLGLAVMLFYSTAGGMVAGLWTDVFQGVLMLVAAVGVFVYALRAGGGLAGIVESIAASPRFGRQFLEPFGETPPLLALGFFFVFGVGVLGQPHMLHKFFMLRDPRALKWFPLVLGGSQMLVLLIWLGVGLAVPALVARGALPPLANPDEAAPAFLLGFTPELLAGVAVAAILAAVMSTADSFSNLGAAALVRDLPKAFGWRAAGGRELARGRVATVAVTLAAAALALAYDDLIALLGTFAFGTFAAALAPALAVGLNWKRVTAAAASASILTGAGLNLGLELLARQTLFPGLPRPPLPPGALPAAVSLAASFTVLLVVSGVSGWRPGRELDPDVAAVMEA
jgi:Na+/proline symporter